MDESLRLSTQQKLQQRLTPMQMQFVRLLEMTAPEIEDEVSRTIEEMPALEVVDNAGNHNDAENDGEEFNETAEELMRADYRNEDEMPSYRLEAHNRSVNDEYNEPLAVSDTETLIDTLTAQLAEYNLSPTDMIIADYIIGNLDDNGYMTRDLRAIADDIAIHQGIEPGYDDMKRVWETVRCLDPAGVGAVDLRDCLLLQLRRLPVDDDSQLATEIVSHYFDLFSKKHYERIAAALDISREQLRRAIEIVTQLNPKPGSILDSGKADDNSRQIIPDFAVDVDGDDITVTLLNNIPELQIEQTFRQETPIPGSTPRERANASTFIRQKRDEAAGFIKILKMRQETLFRVMSAIVRLQRDFFITGDESLIHPMILKDVAAITGEDLSVISRATASKYVLTRQGVYPLKLFFNERPKNDTDTSSHEILATIRDIINREDKRRPLSDELITEKLRRNGLDIARRTVAKYRERLGFPVARLRKEL